MLPKGAIFVVCIVLTIFTVFNCAQSIQDEDFVPLTCIACPAGQYLDQITNNCTQCPVGSSTFEYTNASNVSHCLCEPGFQSVNNTCVHCEIGFHKFELANVSCQTCLPNSETVYTGSDNVDDCFCKPGFSKINVDAHDKECQPCVAGSFKNSLSDEPCAICPANHYCPVGSITPVSCPLNSTSSPSSFQVTDCLCNRGHHFEYTDNGAYFCSTCLEGKYNDKINQSACIQCPANTYNSLTASTTSDNCLNCDVNAASQPGSVLIEDCLCNLGYAGLPGTPCVACEPGTYRENTEVYICEDCPAGTYNVDYASNTNETCRQCESNTHSASGSGSKRDCVCNAGFSSELLYPPAHAEGEHGPFYICTPCAAGSYADTTNTTACSLCAPGKFSTIEQAIAEDTCIECLQGSFTTIAGLTICEQCTANTWQDINVAGYLSLPCQSCPQNSTHNITGSYNVFDCKCVPGLEIHSTTNMFTCELCQASFYCPYDGLTLPCADNHFSVHGITIACTECATHSQGVSFGPLDSAKRCVCVPGAEGTFNDDCTLCTFGKIQPLDYTYDGTLTTEYAPLLNCSACAENTYQDEIGQTVCDTCTPDSSTVGTGHDADEDCICNPGFVGQNGGPCISCLPGFYCPGGNQQIPCRLHSSSAAGASSQAQCSCVPGYYSLEDDTECFKCQPNTYCPGGRATVPCANNSLSQAGSDNNVDCSCAPGYWRGCIQVQSGIHAGEYLNSYSDPCIINWDLPCFECGEDVICRNNTLLHCPEHSTSDSQSHSDLHCVCDDGYYADYKNAVFDNHEHHEDDEVDHTHN